jgi:hypothetical protein
VAGAANCSPWNTGTFVSGGGANAVLSYDAALACNGVEGVRWYYFPPGAGATAGWFDWTAGGWANGRIGNCVQGNCTGNASMTQEDHPGISGNYTYGLGVDIYQYSNVWFYHSCHTIATFWWFQIKNTATHTWGGYANFLGSQTNTCVS